MDQARILIVEDESIVAKDIQNMLDALGYAVTGVVSSGQAAIEQAGQTQADLVLMDIMLKGEMDGVQAAQQIRTHLDIPVIFLTAHADEATLQRAKLTEPFGYLIKPFEERELHTSIEMARYKHKMERRLRESQQWLATTLESIGEGVVATDAGGCIKFMNPVAEMLTGWRWKDAYGHDLGEVFNVVDEETGQPSQVTETTTVPEEDGADLAPQLQLIDKHGNGRPIIGTAGPIRDRTGEAAGSVLVFQDVSNRRQAEQQIQLQAAALESAANGIIITDRQGAIIWVNPAFTQLTGYTADEVFGKSLRTFLPSQQDDSQYNELWETIRSGRVYRGEMTKRRKDGTLYLEEMIITPVRDKRGEITHFISIKQDVSERRQAEERYRALFEESKDVVFISTPDGHFLDINPAGVELLGYDSVEELQQIDITQDLFANPEDREKYNQYMECQGFVKDFPLVLKRKDGQELEVLETATKVRNQKGAIVAHRGIIRDVTKQKQLERQLQQAQKLESLGMLAGGIAHDFNNVLTGILGYVDLLKQEIEPGGGVSEKVGRIETLGQRAADMVNQLLTFSRKNVVQRDDLLLHPYLKEVGKLMERVIPENIEIALRLAPADLTVKADLTQLQQIVMNLIVNARDAMPEGGRMVIETAVVELDDSFCQAHPDTEPGSYVCLSVKDMGMGIPEDIRPHIFDPFFTTKGMASGTGLGLSIVYGIVKNYGGAIEVQSQIGKGTTVHVYLPLAKAPVMELTRPAIQAVPEPETILLVEDEPIVLDVGQMALQRFGYQVLTARDGLEAIAEYQQKRDKISLVFMDMVMPKLGGLEALRELKQLDPSAKVLLTTGYGNTFHTTEELLAEGALGLLRKPYQLQELDQAIREALHHQDQQPMASIH